MLADELKLQTTILGAMNTRRQLPETVKKVQEQDELSLLIRDCIAKSANAQKTLYDRYSPMVYGIIKRYLYKEDSAAGEILNDSFLKIFTKLSQYTFQGAFEGWIRRIVINTLTDHLRKKISTIDKTIELEPESIYISDEGLDKISFKELLGIVQTLPDTQRTVFNLYVFENFSHKEIADMLNLKENNCRWHLNDARGRLKEKLSYLLKR